MTVVTAYFSSIQASVASNLSGGADITELMRNFLPIIPCSLYIFTDAASLPGLFVIRQPHVMLTKYVIVSLDQLPMAQR